MLTFDDITGHEKQIEKLNGARLSDRLSHAYIISGDRGAGKRSIAGAWALELLCERQNRERETGRKGYACLSCHSCRQVMAESHPDLIFIRHEKPASIGVDEIREQVSDTIRIRPFLGGKKIYIIPEAEKLTAAAQNALLKNIEEPPEYAIIILLTANETALLDTIRSRCVSMALRGLDAAVIESCLINRLGADKENAAVCAAYSGGSLGKAIEAAGSEEFASAYRENISILKNIYGNADITGFLALLKAREESINDFLELCRIWYRDILIIKRAGTQEGIILKNEYRSLRELARRYDYKDLNSCIEAIEEADSRLRANVNTEFATELMLLRLSGV